MGKPQKRRGTGRTRQKREEGDFSAKNGKSAERKVGVRFSVACQARNTKKGEEEGVSNHFSE